MAAKTKVDQDQPQPEPQPEPENAPGGANSQPEPKPAEPVALVSVTEYEQTFHRPSVKIMVGAEVVEVIDTAAECPHDPSHGGNKWGHKDAAGALACARALARARGLRIEAPTA